ncbi:SH3 domain-containing protein [Flavobacterium sp. KACC 22763]|uniref:SH3 domain-containing protein n=1 Tax=Flavobacterium sp. KACC 22763 TaxID=3025668 RepID=UPI0023656849|nr:SH3 domain-containing protein [Flavobacterium sp. KACC 22763]WDF62203.1 SH3 domain-containing protein [Flavobacterium sp. KACC 22763]
MKKLYFLFAFCSSFLLHSQEIYYIKSDTRLFTSKNKSSDFLGYFKYGASIKLLSKNENGWYKIQSDNFSEGYVEAKYIAETLNASDIKTKDKENPIIESGDNYYGSPHLFVLAAGLKARAMPDKTSKIREILFTGDPVPVNYYPKSQDEWVNISGTFRDEYNKFVQRKYIGQRPDFDKLINEFDKLDVSKINERKTLSERIVELAWNSGYKKLAPAYQRYSAVVKQINDEKLISETELNELLARKLGQQKTFDEITAISKKAEFSLKGVKTKTFNLPLSELLKLYNQPLKKKTMEDGCGIYLSDTFYYYSDLEVSVDESKNLVEIVKVFLNENNKFILNSKTIFDYKLTERDFIEKYGTYIETSLKTPHHYSLNLEDGQIQLQFKDGKLFSVEIFYYC